MTSGPCVTVLAEDKGMSGEGLSAFVFACVSHVVGGDRWSPQQEIDWRFLGSNSAVLRACGEVGRIAPDGRPVVALLDSDRILRAFITRPASLDEVPATIRAESDRPAQLEVLLLKRNAESVIKAVAACDADLKGSDHVRRALAKDAVARDLVLRVAARSQSVRECVLKEVPSLKALVTRLVEILGERRPGVPVHP